MDPTEDHSMPLRFTVLVSPVRGWQDRQRRGQGRYALTDYMFAGLKFPSNVRSVTEQGRPLAVYGRKLGRCRGWYRVCRTLVMFSKLTTSRAGPTHRSAGRPTMT